MNEWVSGNKRKPVKEEVIEDPDFDPAEWDISNMGLSDLNKEIKRLEEKENEQ